MANLRIYHAVALEKMQKRYTQQANCIYDLFFRAFIFGRGHLCIAFFPRFARFSPSRNGSGQWFNSYLQDQSWLQRDSSRTFCIIETWHPHATWWTLVPPYVTEKLKLLAFVWRKNCTRGVYCCKSFQSRIDLRMEIRPHGLEADAKTLEREAQVLIEA